MKTDDGDAGESKTGARVEWAMDGAVPSLLTLSLVNLFFKGTFWALLADLMLLTASFYYLARRTTDEISATSFGALLVAMLALLFAI